MAEIKNKRLGGSGLERVCRTTKERAGIDKPVFPHCLRISRATFCARQGMNESTMRKIFGWTSISQMPSLYIGLAALDTKNAAMQLAGLKSVEKETPILPHSCLRCGKQAPTGAKFCKGCLAPLTAEAAEKQAETEKNKIKEMVLAALAEKGLA